MDWPTPQDYNEAVQCPLLTFANPELQRGKPELNVLGMPKPMSGNFASVYKLDCGTRTVAVKCFLRNIADQQERYAELSHSINSKELKYTVGFDYLARGITVRDKAYPILKMEWADGLTLDRYIDKHVFDQRAMVMLHDGFKAMLKRLAHNGVAHGDLQHGNILVNDGEIKLVDYDGMFVPSLKGRRSNEIGHPNYQHPKRTEDYFGPYLDYFSAWVIHTTMFCLSIDPQLWERLSGGDDCLIFRQADFQDPLASPTFQILEKHSSEPIQMQARLLRYLLMYPVDQVPALDEGISTTSQLPAIKKAQAAPPPKPQVSGLPDWMAPGKVTYEPPKGPRFNTTGSWPRLDDYKQAILEGGFNFSDDELRHSLPLADTRGLGENGIVFKFRNGTKRLAVKCFKHYVSDRQQRYQAIKKCLTGPARRYFIDFEYLPQGIRVGDYWYPVVKMDWIGPTLNEFIAGNLRNKAALSALVNRFRTMMEAFKLIGIAHGDLEPNNMMIVNGDFKLIDYDGMYLPELADLSGIETGHPAFQHPERTKEHFGPNIDNFSSWIMDAELAYLNVDPRLWELVEARIKAVAAGGMRGAAGLNLLDVHPSKKANDTAHLLRKLYDLTFDEIPYFNAKTPLYRPITHPAF